MEGSVNTKIKIDPINVYSAVSGYNSFIQWYITFFLGKIDPLFAEEIIQNETINAKIFFKDLIVGANELYSADYVSNEEYQQLSTVTNRVSDYYREFQIITYNMASVFLFHIFEQQVHEICASTEDQAKKGWGEGLVNVGIDSRRLDTIPKIQELNLVANAIKHGEGRSYKKLKKKFPIYFRLINTSSLFCKSKRTESLVVTKDDILRFVKYLTDFWHEFYEHYPTP